MQLIIHPVDGKNADELIKYSSAYGPEHDESYLPDHSFKVSEEQPSYLLYDEQKVVGAVSLLRTPRYLSTSQARFSIFHSMLNSVEAYKTLFQAVQPDMQDLERAFLFLPEQNRATIGILKSLGFSIERFAFVLMNKHPEQKPVEFPLQFELIPLERGNDVRLRQFAGCLNENFRDLAGHTHNSPDELRKWFDDGAYLDGGLILLVANGKPAGTLSVMRDTSDSETAEILAFSLSKEHRGRGLGRLFLRFGVNFALNRKFQHVALSVNAENKLALQLYLTEGFIVSESMACYAFHIR
jgi:mycothiol synthase